MQLRESLRLDPRNGEAQYALAKALLELDQPEEAVFELTKAASLLPKDPRPYYLLARAYSKMKKAEEADKALREFAELKKLQAASGGMAYRPN